MRIYYISNLHLDRFDFVPKIKKYKEEEKMLVLAGDIFSIHGSKEIQNEFLLQCFDIFGPNNVYYIKGNHEFYHTVFDEKDLLYVNEGFGTFNLVGCTLWSNFENSNPQSMEECKKYINDFRYIKNFSVDKQIELFNRDVDFITHNLDCNSVIFTHHMPSFRFIDPKYRSSTINGAFASDLDHLIMQHSPRVWIHGHTHSAVSKKIGTTLILCNPFGYLYKENFLQPSDYLTLKWVQI